MKKIIVKVDIEISENRLKDILTCAFEGGSNYWYLIKRFEYPEGETKESLKIKFEHIELPFKNGRLVISDIIGEKDIEYILDWWCIQMGTQVMARDYPKYFNDFICENEDSMIADVWLQCCIFGEVIYS